MEIQEVRKKADALGVDYSLYTSKPALVRSIQRRLGQPACFATDERFRCSATRCPWRPECQKPIAEWLR